MALLLPVREIMVGFHSLLFPAACPGCTAPLEDSRAFPLCGRCLSRLPRLEPPWCPKCGGSLAGVGTGTQTCRECRNTRFSFEQAVSVFRHESPLKELLAAFKYKGLISAGPYLGGHMAEAVRKRLSGKPVDALVAVPLHPVRLRERTYNQAQILAAEMGKRLQLPCWNRLLIRSKSAIPQAELSGKQRRVNVRLVFGLAAEPPAGAHVILVDDVFTTGSTLEACAALLKKAGVSQVTAATLSRQALSS